MGGPMADNDTETHPIDPPLEVAIPIPSGSTNFFKGLEETSSSSLFYPPLYPHRTPSINPQSDWPRPVFGSGQRMFAGLIEGGVQGP